MIRLERPAAGSPNFRAVLALAKEVRATAGFLTNAAFAQRAEQGTLLAALMEERVAGYVLYDLPRDEIRVVQLVVSLRFRSLGIARQLIDQVAGDHAERRGIFLHCRNDFPADALWPKLDFEPLGERPGRSFSGKPLTRWYRSFGQPDLFTYLHEDDARPIATMDACVFFDLVAKRPKPVAAQLRADWLGEHVRLAVTGHLSNEIHRGSDARERQRQASAQEQFRLGPQPAKMWRSVFERLLAANPDAPAKDHDDLIHAAQSVACGATWLLTTDRPFVQRYGAAIAEAGGVRLVSPSAFLREIDELARSDRYRPVDLSGTDVTRREADAASLGGLAESFVNHQAGERLRAFRAKTELAAARASDVHLELIEVDGQSRGLAAWELTTDSLIVVLLRATTGLGETTIGRQLLGLIRDEAARCGRNTIRIQDEFASSAVTRSFRDEGFAMATDGVVVAHALPGVYRIEDLHARARTLGSPLAESDLFSRDAGGMDERAALLERWFSPARIVGAGIPTLFVPIRHGWATDLVDAGLAEEQLLHRPWGLGLRREHVYYRSPRNPASLPVPARLLWYVSGTAAGARTIRAVSHLTEVRIAAHDQTFRRFQPLGVYEAEDVRRIADKRTGRVMAMRFSSTVRLDYPVGLDTYRELMTGNPKSRRIMLQSVHQVSEHVFVRLIQHGSKQCGVSS